MENKENNILNRLMSDYDRRSNTSPISVSNQPLIVNTDELIRKSIERNAFLQSYNKDYWDSYAKYNVFPSHTKTQEQLDRERAENQSGIEQFGRFIGQSVGNEIVLGTVRGLFDMVDAAVNAAKAVNAAVTGDTDNLNNDYINPISKYLIEQQDKLRQRLEIYEKDPSKSFAIGDFGWWMNNATSILSSVALLLPSVGTVKGLSYIGKLSKQLRLVDKSLNVGKKLSEANKAAKVMIPTKWGQRAELISSSVLSRTMENYQEGRDVYEQVYDSVLQELQNMPDVQKNYFLENNPEFNGKTNEEIAEQLASKKATNTFVSDYALLLFDVMQLKALNNFWKSATRESTVGLRQANKEAIKGLSKQATEEGTEQTAKFAFLNKVKDWANYSIKHPLESPAVAQLSEGVEEGYQGIASAYNIDSAEAQILGTKEQIALSYLSDLEVWEQAFWGWIGGMTFQGLGSGIGKLSRKVKAEANKKNLTKEEYNQALLGEEQSRRKEIEDRIQLLETYKDKMDLINQGLNPYRQTTDGKYLQFTSEEQKESAKKELTTQLVTEMTINAVNNGNYELLREYITDDNFDKWFIENGIDTSLSKLFINQMDEVANQYEDVINKVQNSTNTAHPIVTQLAASQIVRQKQNAKYNDKLLNIELSELENDSEFINLSQNAKDTQISTSAQVLLKELQDEETFIRSQYEKGSEARIIGYDSKGNPRISRDIVSKESLEEKLNEINKKRQFILNYVKQNTTFGQLQEIADLTNLEDSSVINEIYTRFNKWWQDNFAVNEVEINNLSDNIKQKYNRYIQGTIINEYNKSTIPNTKQAYKEQYDIFEGALDDITNYRMDRAYKNVTDYIKSQDNLNQALDNILKEENISDELKQDLKILKLGSQTSMRYTRNLINLVDSVNEDRTREQERPENITSGDKEVDNATRTNIESSTLSSTGEVQNAPTAQTDKTTTTDTTVTTDTTISTNTSEEPTPTPVKEDDAQTNTDENYVETINSDGTLTRETIPVDQQEQIDITSDEEKAIEQINEAFGIRLGYGTSGVIDITDIGQQFNGMLRNPSTRDKTLDAINKGFGSKELNDIINELIDYVIIQYGSSQEEAFNAVKSAIKLRLEQFNTYNQYPNEKTKQNAIRLINELATKTIIDFDDLGNFSKVESIDNNEYIRKAEELIKLLYDNNIPNQKGIIELDIQDVFKRLFDYCKSNNISIDEAKAIYYQFRKIIHDNSTRSGKLTTEFGKIKFNNYKLFLTDENNFFQLLIDAYTSRENIDNKYHVRVSRGISIQENTVLRSNKEVAEVIKRNIGKKANIKFNGRGENVKSAVITINDKQLGEVEIGYIPFVDVSADNNTIKLRTADMLLDESHNKNQWRFVITKNNDGTYSLNIDDIIENIINNEDETIYNTIRKFAVRHKYGIGFYPTGEELEKFYDSEIIQKLINPSNGYYKTISTDLSKQQHARLILQDLANIIFYNKDTTINNDKSLIQVYYNIFKEKIFDNYTTTKTIEDSLRNSENGKIQITLESAANRKLIIQDEEHSINDIHIDTNKHKIVFVNQEGKIQVEDSSEVFDNVPGFNLGTMGFLIDSHEGNPFVATFTSANRIADGNQKLWNAIEKELRDKLNNYYNAKTRQEIDKSWIELKDALMNLINTDKDGLFKGFRVFYNQDKESINVTYFGNTKQNVFIFNKYSANVQYDAQNKKYRDFEGRLIDFDNIDDNEYLKITDKETFVIIPEKNVVSKYHGRFDNATNRIINIIKDKLVFNNTGFSIRNNGIDNVNETSYFSKENGRLKIKIGEHEETYSNFGELVLKNNAFNTRQGVGEDGDYFKLEDVTNSIFFNVNSIITPEDNYENIKDIITSATKEKPVKVEDLLYEYGYAKTEVDRQTIGEVSIMPKEIYYDVNSTNPGRAYTEKGTNKVVITKNGINYLRDNLFDLPRLLIHENIHAKINSSDFFRGRIGTRRINETLETLRQFEEYLNNDNSNTKEVIDLKKFLKEFREKHSLLYTSETRYSKEKLANEWMAEVFSQSTLANYLNRIEYKEDRISLVGVQEQQQTLFSKLVDLLVQLFENINKNSILDQLVRISKLSKPNTSINRSSNTNRTKRKQDSEVRATEDITLFPLEEEMVNQEMTTETESVEINTNSNSQEETPVTEEEPIDTNEYNINETLDDDYDFNDIESLSSEINPVSNENIFTLANSGVQTGQFIRSDDMSDFVRSFRINDRALMASELAENKIKYYCQ